MATSNTTQRSGVSLSTVVQTVFIILKLTGLVDWSWWVVLIPLWIGLGTLVLMGIGFVIYVVTRK